MDFLILFISVLFGVFRYGGTVTDELIALIDRFPFFTTLNRKKSMLSICPVVSVKMNRTNRENANKEKGCAPTAQPTVHWGRATNQSRTIKYKIV